MSTEVVLTAEQALTSDAARKRKPLDYFYWEVWYLPRPEDWKEQIEAWEKKHRKVEKKEEKP